MSAIEIVYFDIDGVLADFKDGIERVTGRSFESVESDGPTSISDTIEEHIDNGFFENLLGTKYCTALIRFMNELRGNGYEVEILSAISDENPEKVLTQKTNWLKNFSLGGFKTNFVTTSSHKARYASENALLVDDRWKAVKPFMDAGGKAILYADDFETFMDDFVNIVKVG